MRTAVLAVATVTLGMLLLACQGVPASPGPGDAAEPAPDGEGHLAPASLGEQLFTSAGCVGCHGEGGQGTDIAPGLPGHSRTQVFRQARAPVGIMPIFPPDSISNEELSAIADYVEGLEGEHTHVMAGGVGEQMVLHHWMALFAVEAEDGDEAVHHIDHIIGLTEGQHLARMEDSKELIEQGDLHEGAHIIEEMLSGLDTTDGGEAVTHLKLGLSALRVEELDDAAHHVEHFAELSGGHEAEKVEEIIGLLQAGDTHEAEHELEELLGEAASDDGHDGDHEEEEEGHEEGADDHDDDHDDDHADNHDHQ